MFYIRDEFSAQIRDKVQDDISSAPFTLRNGTLDEIIVHARQRARDFVANELIGRETIGGSPTVEMTEAYYIMAFIDALRADRIVNVLCDHIEAQQKTLDEQIDLFVASPTNPELAHVLSTQITTSGACLQELWSLVSVLGYRDILFSILSLTVRGRGYMPR